MALFKRPLQKQFYRDYVKSTFWQLRKRRYISRHGRGCEICADTDRVDVYHLRAGDYGHERDADLVALCRAHHLEFQEMIEHEGDNFDRAAFIREKMAEHEAEQEGKVIEPLYEYTPSFFSSVHMVLDMIARPIWRFWYGLMRW